MSKDIIFSMGISTLVQVLLLVIAFKLLELLKGFIKELLEILKDDK